MVQFFLGNPQSWKKPTPREDAEALRWSFWTVTEVEKDALTVLMHRLAMPAEERKHELAEAAEKRLAVPLRVLEQHLASLVAAGTITYEDAVASSVHPEDIAGMANMARQTAPAS